MASVSATTTPRVITLRFNAEWRHKLRLYLTWLLAATVILWTAYQGFPFYRLNLADRAYSPLQPVFRPSGAIGLRLGILGLGMFFCLFLYPIRKRWPWLARIGKTKHWLDFHALLGISAPLVITLHSSFKLRGLAGLAYWIMIAVAVSGFAGRYLYSQIPRSLNTAELSLKEIQNMSMCLAQELERQAVLRADEIAPLLNLPSPQEVAHLSWPAAFWTMARLDIARPFQVSRLRRRFLSGPGRVATLGGLLPSRRRELEQVISAIRTQSWLSAKMLFLKRVHDVFHLWHVVHRPFSYSFAALVLVHVGVALLLGYF